MCFVLSNHQYLILAVDQPAGTGFSYTSTDSYVHTIDAVSVLALCHLSDRDGILPIQVRRQFLEFLKNFYNVFPELRMVDVCLIAVSTSSTTPHPSFKTYLSGESFAGQWIPYLGGYLFLLIGTTNFRTNS